MNKCNIQIECQDGFELSATLYSPKSVKGAVMIAPATGIKRRFYNSFATHLSECGYGVICFDYRGIGDSKNGNINTIDASLINWGRLDMTAVFNALKTYFPNQVRHVVGHSAGGQLIGLMDNAHEISSLFNFASSSGSLKHMQYPFKLKAAFFLNVFIPVSNILFGKTNSQWVDMGEPLPKKVANQWNKWCSAQGYVETAFGKEIKQHHYNDMKLRTRWVHATDDGIANYANVKDMTRVFSKSDIEIITLDPNDLGKKALGHMGFFSSKNKDLWPLATEWLDKSQSQSKK